LKKVDIGVSISLFATSVYFIYLADKIPTSAKFSDVSAAIWPKIILGCMIVSCIILFIKSLKGSVSQSHSSGGGENRRLLAPVLLCLAYLLTMRWIGFLISSAIFSITYMYLLGFRKKSRMVLISLAAPILIGLLFYRLLYVPIPKGVWIFKTITEAFLSL